MIAWNFQRIVGTCQFRVPWFGYPCGYSSLTFHAHKQIIFLQYKRSSPIVKNDGDSQERMLQNTLILRGQEAVRIMLKGFLCLTQPAFTRRPWRGNALPRRRVGALLCFDIILTDSRPLRTADFAACAPASLLFVALSLTKSSTKLLTILD